MRSMSKGLVLVFQYSLLQSLVGLCQINRCLLRLGLRLPYTSKKKTVKVVCLCSCCGLYRCNTRARRALVPKCLDSLTLERQWAVSNQEVVTVQVEVVRYSTLDFSHHWESP